MPHKRLHMVAAEIQIELSLAEGYREAIQGLIGNDLVAEALDRLQDFVRDLAPAHCNDALLLRQTFARYTRDVRRGVAKRDDIFPIVSRILELTDEVHRVASVLERFRLDTTPAPVSSDVTSAPAAKLRLGVTAAVTPADVAVPRYDAPQPLIAQHPGGQPFPAAGNEERSSSDTLEEVKRIYWLAYRRERPRHDTVAFAARDVTKSYGRGTFSLEPISFELRVGEITGVVGRNASGKTTLLRIVMGDLLQDSGTTEYPLLTRDRSGWAHIKRQISDVPQFPEKWRGRLRPNLNYVAAVHGIRGRRNNEIVDWHVARYALNDYEDAKWNEISGGYKIRFELVRALVTKPRLLVLDEPLAYLDVMARQEFLKNLRTIATSFEEPVPIIITSQHLYEIEAVADQLILVDDGRCIYAGPQAAIGAMVPRRMIEITLKARQSELAALLEPVGLRSVEATLEGFILGFDKTTSADIVFRALFAHYGERLLDFRDITSSARALFDDKVAHPKAAAKEYGP